MGLPLLLLLVLGAALVAVLTLGAGPGLPERVASACLTLLPALLLSVIIQLGQSEPLVAGHRGADTPWRVTLAAVRFPLQDERVSIGGDAQTDNLYIPGLPPKMATSLSLDTGASQDLLIRDSLPGPRGGALALLAEQPGQGSDAFGGTRIAPGSEICLSDDGMRCRPDSQHLSWVLQGDTALLRDGSGAALCTLPPPGSSRAASTTAKRVFPLATYARQGCAGKALFTWDEGEPAGELLYWGEGAPTLSERLAFWRKPERALYLRPVDYARLLLVRSGGEATRIQRRPLRLAPGQERRLSLYEIIPATDLPSGARGDDNFARLQERRSFLLRYTQASAAPVLDVFLDTPQTVSVAAPARPALSISSQSASVESLVGTAQIAGFSLLGKRTAAALLSTVRLARSPENVPEPCRGQNEPLIVQGVTSITCAQVGRWFALGDPRGVLAKLRIAPLTVPVAWIAAIWMLFLINVVVRDALRIAVPVRVLLGVLEMLLVLRLLVAFEAAAIDSRREDAVAGAWIALLWLPLVFELLPASSAGPLTAALARASKLLLALSGTVFIAHIAGVGSLSGWGSWMYGDMGKSALVSLGLCLPAWGLLRSPRLGSALHHPGRLAGERGLIWAAMPLGALFVLHLGLLAVGIKEQIGGVRIAAALIPLLVLAWAHWYASVRRVRDSLSPGVEMLALFGPFLAYLNFALARDIGAFVYFVALAVWLSVGAWPSRARGLLLWLALGAAIGSSLLIAMTTLGSVFRPLLVPGAVALLAALLAAFVLAPLGQLQALRPHLASIPALAVLAILCALQVGGGLLRHEALAAAGSRGVSWAEVSRIQGLSGNAIRMLDLLAPQAVENLGIRAAYEQRVAMAEMLEYGASLAGRGWLHVPAPDALRQTHVDDNVTAVHLLGPFGRAGGLGVGILLIAFAASMQRLATARSAAAGARAGLAATMLVATSLYMLLANIGQVPFTGRNFYFLAVASHSDLLEGGLLLVIVLSAFSERAGPAVAVRRSASGA